MSDGDPFVSFEYNSDDTDCGEDVEKNSFDQRHTFQLEGPMFNPPFKKNILKM